MKFPFRGHRVSRITENEAENTTPDLSDEPEESRTPQPGELRMIAAHRNLMVDPDGTWAFFLLDDVNWPFATPGRRASIMSGQTHRWAELTGRRVRIYGTASPYNYKAYAARLDAEHPSRDDAEADEKRAVSRRVPDVPGEWYFDDVMKAVQRRIAERDARKSATVLAVRLTEQKVVAKDLPALLSPNPLGESRGTLEQHRRTLRQVTASVAEEGFGGRPLRAAVLGWLVHANLGMGAPVPPVLLSGERDGWTDLEIPGFTNPVYATHAPYAATTTVRTLRHGEQFTANVAVLHASKFERRNLDDPSQEPWLSWINNTLPFPVRYVAELDIVKGADLKEQAEYNRRLGINQREHFEEHDEEPPIEVERGIQRSREVLDEVTNGDAAMSARARGVLLVALVGEDEDEALELTRKFISQASEKQGITFTHDYAQYESYRSFTPGEPIRRTGHLTQMPATFLGAAVPNASTSFGDPTGWYVGPIAGGHDIYVHDPHGGAARGRSNMQAIGGDQGAGKTTAMSAICLFGAELGMRTVISDPANQMHKLCKLPQLRNDSRHLDLMHVRPGTLSPTLEAEPLRGAYNSDEEFALAVENAARDRMGLLVDTFKNLLPYSMIQYDTGAVGRTITAAVSQVGGTFGEDPWRYVAWMRERGGETGREIAESIEARAKFKDGALVFPTKGSELDPDYNRRLMEQATLTVVTLKGLALPPSDGSNRASWTDAQQQSVPILNLAARFTSNVMYLDLKRKLIGQDELGIQVASGSSYGAWLSRASVETRRQNTWLGLLFQNPGMLMRIDDEIPNLVGSAWIGRMEEETALAALRILRLKQGFGYEQIISNLPKGHFLGRDWTGRHRVFAVDQGHWREDVLDALDTNAEGRGREYDVRTARDDVFEGAA